MHLKSLTQGKQTGEGTLSIEHKFGGALITANEDRGFTRVIVRRVNAQGKAIFDMAVKASGSHIFPISTEGAKKIHYEIRHGYAQLFEWVE